MEQLAMQRQPATNIRRKTLLALASGALLAIVATVAAAQGPPEFQKGKWEFTRSTDGGAGTPQTLTTSRCTNPSEEMRTQRDKGAKAGCKSSPVARSGSTYTYTVSCDFRGVPVESTSVMTVDSASAYKISIQSKGGGKATNETLVAKRIGDC